MKWITIVALCLALCACASKPTQEVVQKDLAKAEEVRAQSELKRSQQRKEQTEQYLVLVPAWAQAVPRPDSSGFYAVGSAQSDNWTLARKKALLEAEFGLAKQFAQELSGSERSYTHERGDKGADTQFTALIDKLVARVPLTGFEVVQLEVKALQGAFHSWVLLKLPYAQFNQVLQAQRTQTMAPAVKEAFDELDRRVAARLQERQTAQLAAPAAPAVQTEPTTRP